MAQRDIYAFDCGTTNWRLYRLSCEETVKSDGTRLVTPLSDPQRVVLATFAGPYLPAALLLDEEGELQSVGNEAYEWAQEPGQRSFLRDAFKLCFGNHESGDPMDARRRYTHKEALTYHGLLLKQIVGWLAQEKLGRFKREHLFFFAHPVHWGREQEDGQIKGQLLADFAAMVRSCFPAELHEQIHFVPEPEAALVSLSQTGHLSSDGRLYTLVVDVGGGTTDFVAGRWTEQGLQDVGYHGEAHGSGLFDHDLALYVANVLQLSEAQREETWLELRHYGKKLKENLSRQVRLNPTRGVRMKVSLELADEAGRTNFIGKTLTFQRETFEEQTRDTALNFENLVLRALVKMELRKSDIGQVVLVGGGANLYLVPQLLEEIFADGIVVYGDPPEETIARGTALRYAQPKPVLLEVTVAANGSSDSPTLEQAITMVAEGGTINLLAGEHRLREPLLLEKSVRLVGDEMETTTVVGDSEEYVLKFAGSGQFEAEGITFRYEGATWADVVVATDGEVRFASCRFSGGKLYQDEEGVHGGNGLLLSGTVQGQVYQCRAQENESHGILVSQQAQPTLEENCCRENKGFGISYVGSAGGTARKNECVANGGGLLVDEQAHPQLEENLCRENQLSGLGYKLRQKLNEFEANFILNCISEAQRMILNYAEEAGPKFKDGFSSAATRYAEQVELLAKIEVERFCPYLTIPPFKLVPSSTETEVEVVFESVTNETLKTVGEIVGVLAGGALGLALGGLSASAGAMIGMRAGAQIGEDVGRKRVFDADETLTAVTEVARHLLPVLTQETEKYLEEVDQLLVYGSTPNG